MKVIGVCNRKGGAGKSTLAVNLAAELASRGRSVVLIDTDSQGSAAHWSRLGENALPVLAMPVTRPQDIDALKRAMRVGPPARDFAIMDAPPHLDAALGAVIGLADLAVIPCSPSSQDVHATVETIRLVRQIRDARGDSKPQITIVPNRVDQRTIHGRDLAEALAQFGEDVSPTIHSRSVFVTSFGEGVSVGAYRPKSPAHAEVIAVTDHALRLLGERTRRSKA